MKEWLTEWFNERFFSHELLGDKILNILIGIFGVLFVGGWICIILFVIFSSIYEKLGRFTVEYKMEVINDVLRNFFRYPLKLIPNSVDSFFFYNKEKLRLIKSIVTGLSLPTIAAVIWLVSSSSPINDYLLITNSKITKGYIVKFEEETDIIDSNDGRSSHLVYYFDYDYYFILPNGKTISTVGSKWGKLPGYLKNLKEPYQVEVEYLANNPQISQVKGMNNNVTTVFQWIRHEILFGTIVILFLSYLGFMNISHGIKDFRKNKILV